ncbi:MAG: efflux RND transporter permease subunit, partial [Bernardetiaceae bacterium]
MSLTEIAIKRPSLIIVIFSVLILGGLYSYHQLGYQLMPNFSQPIINVVTVYPGATPSEVESKVTRPIEDAISALDRIDDINSKSYENISVVTIGFESGTNLDKMMQEAQRKIDNIKSELPDDVKSPSLSKVSQDDLPIMHLIATSDLSSGAFYTLIEDQIKPQIQQISGVGEIIMLGGEEREIRINADLDKLNYYGISLLQLNSAIQAANIEIPTGKVETSQSQATLRLSGKFQSMDEIREQVILSMGRHNSPVRIGDVADITDATKDVSTIARLNGKTGIAFLIKKQPDANAVAISHQVKQQIETIERLYASQNVKVLISEDSADFTMESVEAVQHDLVIAIILVASVMLLFLHSLRNALIVMLSIPTSLISTLIAMHLLGYSFNLMTLLAMSLVIGILVDDSIVVLENIQRHLEMGKDKRKAALDGRNEIGFSALAITFVDVVVFLPIIVFVNTTVGEVLRQFSVVVVVSTLMSLFVCFTLTPWLASRFGKVPHLNPQNPFGWFLIQFEHGLDQFTNWYKTQLIWALNNRIISFCIILSCFGGLGWMMSLGIMGEELVAAGDQGKLTLGLEFDKRSSIENTNLQTRQVEDMLLARPEVKTVFANIGGPSTVGGSLGAANKSELSVKLVDKNQRRQSTEELMLAMREEIISRIPGVNVEVSKVSIKGGAAPLQIVLTAADYDKLFAVAQRLKEKMQQLPGVDNVKISVEDGAPELNISIDREQLATLALDMRMVAGTLRTAFNGNDDAEFKDGSNNYDIRLMADRFDRENPDDLRNIEIINQRGEPVKFSQFATIS